MRQLSPHTIYAYISNFVMQIWICRIFL